MWFGVGKPPTARQTSWARLKKYSYCLGLTGRHHPPQGRHPVSAMPCGWTDCISFTVMSQSMRVFIAGLWSVWFQCPLHDFPGDFLNSFLKNCNTDYGTISEEGLIQAWYQLRHYSITWTCVGPWKCRLLWMNKPCQVGVHADQVVLKIACHHVTALVVRTTNHV